MLEFSENTIEVTIERRRNEACHRAHIRARPLARPSQLMRQDKA
jgi:hypothetical protein